MAISALELLVSNLERRRLATGDEPVWPRICDLPLLAPAITGKIEMVYEGEQQGADMVVRKLLGAAVLKVFGEQFPEIGREAGSGGEDDTGPYAELLAWFADGNSVQLSDETPFAEHLAALERVPGLMELATAKAESTEERAFWAELALEGLHQSVKIARHDLDSQVTYKEMLKFHLLKPQRRGPRSTDLH
jgi:magnesium chelatase subunit I